MIVHNVFFWLKPDLSADQVSQFRQGLESLKGMDFLEGVYIGTPADTGDRPAIERGYSFGLTVLFKEMAAHDQYQTHPLHTAFLQQFAPYWDKVLIYDIQEYRHPD